MFDVIQGSVVPKPRNVRGRPRIYPLPEMMQWDTFTVPYDGEPVEVVYIRVRTSVLRWARLNQPHWKFSVEKRDDHVFVQRTE